MLSAEFKKPKVIEFAAGILTATNLILPMSCTKQNYPTENCPKERSAPMFDAEAEKAKVLEHAAGLLAAENAKEPEKASGFYSDNVYFVAPGMDIVNGNAKLKEVLVAALTGSFTNSHEYLDVQFSEGGDMCFVVFKYSISTDDPEFNFPKSGKAIFVMQKKNGKWEIAVNCFNN